MITPPFTLTLSYGGGFTGQYEGYTLSSPDSVISWRQRAAGPRVVQWARKADPESLDAFVRELEPYFDMESAETGNMTARIELQSPQDQHAWSMAGAPASPDAPEPFRNWYPRVETYCRGLGSAP
jgi:hypothetical protein